jgi:hypothetical protein
MFAAHITRKKAASRLTCRESNGFTSLPWCITVDFLAVWDIPSSGLPAWGGEVGSALHSLTRRVVHASQAETAFPLPCAAIDQQSHAGHAFLALGERKRWLGLIRTAPFLDGCSFGAYGALCH